MIEQSPQALATERMLDAVEARLVPTLAAVLSANGGLSALGAGLRAELELILIPAIIGRITDMADESPVIVAAGLPFGMADRFTQVVRKSVDRAIQQIPARVSDFRTDRSVIPQADAVARRLARWVARTALFDAQEQLTPEFGAAEKRWVTVGDDRVRHNHAILDGKRRKLHQPFITPAGAIMHPGDTSAPIELWINCRCHLEFLVPRAS